MKTWRMGAVGVTLVGLAGCCATRPPAPPGGVDRRTLPPPISLDEQVRALNTRAHSVPLLWSKLSRINMTYRDAAGKDHTQSIDSGNMLLRQRFWQAGALAGCDVALLGTAFSQPAIRAGANQNDWWFIVLGDEKTAYTGAVREDGPTPSPGAGRASVLHAALVPDLLGITEIVLKYGEAAMLRVNDDRATNDVLIVRFRPDGTAWIKREIVVDRRSGDVKEVNVYDAAGVLLVRSTLSDPQPIKYGIGPAATGVGPKMPRKVKIDYPSEQTTVDLEFEQVTIPPAIPDTSFATPDFAEQNLRVIHEDQ